MQVFPSGKQGWDEGQGRHGGNLLGGAEISRKDDETQHPAWHLPAWTPSAGRFPGRQALGGGGTPDKTIEL